MPLLKNKLQKPSNEPSSSVEGQPLLDPLKKLTLKERMALRKQGGDIIPMDDDEPPFSPGGDDKLENSKEVLDEHKKVVSTKKVVIVEDSDDGLPTEPSSQIVSMTSLNWLAIAPPGFGKTETFALFPDSLMLACEGGHKFIVGHKLLIDEWEGKGDQKDDDGNIHVSFREAVKRIGQSTRFKFIVIDTLDALIKKCIDHHVSKANQQHLADLGDYGKGFDLGQNDPIRRMLNEIINTGRGVGLITHQQVNTNNFSKGAKSKKETSLPNGIHKIIFPQMDIVIHGEYGGIREKNQYRDRIWRSVGNEDMLAKNRGGILPPAFISPYDKEERREQIAGFFNPDANERKKAVDAAYAEYVTYYGEVE